MVSVSTPVSSTFDFDSSIGTAEFLTFWAIEALRTIIPFLDRNAETPLIFILLHLRKTFLLLQILRRATEPKTGLYGKRIVLPNRVNLTFESEPPGLELVVDGEVLRTPTTVISWANHVISVHFDQGHWQC
jgi:hypothetical protein